MLKKLGLFVILLVVLAGTVWGSLALYFTIHGAMGLLLVSVLALLGLATLVCLSVQRWQWPLFGMFSMVFLALQVWWAGIEPSNDREWQPEVARLPYATINEDLVTVFNIRNFDYRTEQDFTAAYYDRTYDLNAIVSVDVINVYWMGPAIAHTFFSFGFENGDHLAMSVETRKEKGEGYSTIKGFFKQYELYYVVADERDVIGVRTNYREPREDVYVYRLQNPAANGRRLFMQYIDSINRIKDEPAFYNTVLQNCTTTVWLMNTDKKNRIPFSWKLLANGYVPDYLYERGLLDTRMTFEKLKAQAYINKYAQQAIDAKDFSQQIRRQK